MSVRYLPALFARADQADPQERLDYLLAEIQAKSTDNPELQALLTEYNQKFNGTEPGGSGQTGLPQTTTKTDPAVTASQTTAPAISSATEPTTPTTATAATSEATTPATVQPTPLPTQAAPSPVASTEEPRKAALALRNEAQPLFEQGEYTAALPLYLQAYDLDPRSYGGGVAYYVGRCYQLLEQPEKARPYFEYVVEEFDGRDIARSAASRLRELGD